MQPERFIIRIFTLFVLGKWSLLIFVWMLKYRQWLEKMLTTKNLHPIQSEKKWSFQMEFIEHFQIAQSVFSTESSIEIEKHRTFIDKIIETIESACI